MTVTELIAKLRTIEHPDTAVVLTHSPHCCRGAEPDDEPEVHYDLPHHTVYIVDWPGEYNYEKKDGTIVVRPHTREYRMPPDARLI